MSWLGRPANTLSQHWPLLTYLASFMPPWDLPRFSCRGPRGRGGEAREGEGWPCLGGLGRYPPRRRCLAADPAARIPVICGPLSQWESVALALSLFVGLQPPPRHCGRHLEQSRAGRRGLVALQARGTHSGHRAPRAGAVLHSSGSQPPRPACTRPSPTPRASVAPLNPNAGPRGTGGSGQPMEAPR